MFTSIFDMDLSLLCFFFSLSVMKFNTLNLTPFLSFPMYNFSLSEKYLSETKILDVAVKIKLSATENPEPSLH